LANDIFISYRRSHTQYVAGRLKDELDKYFEPPTHVFRDIENIEPGLDFTKALDKSLASSAVMLILVDKQWADVRTSDGSQRRLDDPDDFVRLEVVRALQRDIRVIPVLIEGAAAPSVQSLPEPMRGLAARQGFELSDGRWRSDIQRLVEALAKVPGLTMRGRATPTGRSKKLLWGAVGGLLVAAVAGIWWELRQIELGDPVGTWRSTDGDVITVSPAVGTTSTYDFEAVTSQGARSPGQIDLSTYKWTMTYSGKQEGWNCVLKAKGNPGLLKGTCKHPTSAPMNYGLAYQDD